MGSYSYPKHLKGRRALPATDEATKGVEINWSRAAENLAAAEEIDPSDLEGFVGSGTDGKITVADIRNWGKEPEEG